MHLEHSRSILVFAVVLSAAGACTGQTLVQASAFDVAAIKPCEPGTPEPPGLRAGMVRYTFPGGRFEAHATTVEFLLEWAYGLLPSQHSPGPAWIDKDLFDITAKAPGNATDDEMKLMTQNLLAERFHLKIHHETREAPVLILSLGKTPPKLFPPKEGEVPKLQIIPKTDDDQKVVSYHVVATRYSFSQLNRTIAWQIGRVIVNQTGLDGDYDYTLDFTPDENRPNPLDSSLWIAALQYQLGLIVKPQKGPVDFLVIDSVEKATEQK